MEKHLDKLLTSHLFKSSLETARPGSFSKKSCIESLHEQKARIIGEDDVRLLSFLAFLGRFRIAGPHSN